MNLTAKDAEIKTAILKDASTPFGITILEACAYHASGFKGAKYVNITPACKNFVTKLFAFMVENFDLEITSDERHGYRVYTVKSWVK